MQDFPDKSPPALRPSPDGRGTLKVSIYPKVSGSISDAQVWVIEIDDIIEFIKKVECDCIVSAPGKYVEDYPKIEIYDDYRE